MTQDAVQERADRYKALIVEAETLGIKHPAKRTHYAAMVLSREEFVASLILGDKTDTAVLLKIDEAIAPLLPKEPFSISVQYIEGISGRCSRCGHVHEPGDYEPITLKQG